MKKRKLFLNSMIMWMMALIFVHSSNGHAINIHYDGLQLLSADATLQVKDDDGNVKSYQVDPSQVQQVMYSNTFQSEDLSIERKFNAPKCSNERSVDLGDLTNDFTIKMKTVYGIEHTIIMKASAGHRSVEVDAACVSADGKTVNGLKFQVRQDFPPMVQPISGLADHVPASVKVIDRSGALKEYAISPDTNKATENETSFFMSQDGMMSLCMTGLGVLAEDFPITFKDKDGQPQNLVIGKATASREVNVFGEFDCKAHDPTKKVITRLEIDVRDGDPLIKSPVKE